jgi:hypothetical protein
MGGADLDLVAFALLQDVSHGLMEGASEHDDKEVARLRRWLRRG